MSGSGIGTDTLNQSSAKKNTIKDFAKAFNNIVQSNFFDDKMISKADREAVKKTTQPKPTLEQVAARLWACHE